MTMIVTQSMIITLIIAVKSWIKKLFWEPDSIMKWPQVMDRYHFNH